MKKFVYEKALLTQPYVKSGQDRRRALAGDDPEGRRREHREPALVRTSLGSGRSETGEEDAPGGGERKGGHRVRAGAGETCRPQTLGGEPRG